MKLLQAFRLIAGTTEAEQLRATMRAINAACECVGEHAFAHQTADRLRLRRDLYRPLRARFGLPAQLAVLAVSKACEGFRRDRSRPPRFAPLDAVPYDPRLYSFRHGPGRLTIATLSGRVTVPAVHAAYFPASVDGADGQADLAERDGRLLFFATVDVPDGITVPLVQDLPADLHVRNRVAPSVLPLAVHVASVEGLSTRRASGRHSTASLRLVTSSPPT